VPRPAPCRHLPEVPAGGEQYVRAVLGPADREDRRQIAVAVVIGVEERGRHVGGGVGGVAGRRVLRGRVARVGRGRGCHGRGGRESARRPLGSGSRRCAVFMSMTCRWRSFSPSSVFIRWYGLVSMPIAHFSFGAVVAVRSFSSARRTNFLSLV